MKKYIIIGLAAAFLSLGSTNIKAAMPMASMPSLSEIIKGYSEGLKNTIKESLKNGVISLRELQNKAGYLTKEDVAEWVKSKISEAPELASYATGRVVNQGLPLAEEIISPESGMDLSEAPSSNDVTAGLRYLGESFKSKAEEIRDLSRDGYEGKSLRSAANDYIKSKADKVGSQIQQYFQQSGAPANTSLEFVEQLESPKMSIDDTIAPIARKARSQIQQYFQQSGAPANTSLEFADQLSAGGSDRMAQIAQYVYGLFRSPGAYLQSVIADSERLTAWANSMLKTRGLGWYNNLPVDQQEAIITASMIAATATTLGGAYGLYNWYQGGGFGRTGKRIRGAFDSGMNKIQSGYNYIFGQPVAGQ